MKAYIHVKSGRPLNETHIRESIGTKGIKKIYFEYNMGKTRPPYGILALVSGPRTTVHRSSANLIEAIYHGQSSASTHFDYVASDGFFERPEPRGDAIAYIEAGFRNIAERAEAVARMRQDSRIGDLALIQDSTRLTALVGADTIEALRMTLHQQMWAQHVDVRRLSPIS